MWCGCLSSCCHPLFMCRLLPLVSCGETVLPRKGEPSICVIIRQDPEQVFLICNVPEPTGLSLPLKDFCTGKSFKKPLHPAGFLVANAAASSVVLSLLGEYAVREEHCTCKRYHLFALSEPIHPTHVGEGFITCIHLHGIFQAHPYPHVCAKSVKGSIHISVECCRVWNIQCGHTAPVVPKVQTPACLLGTKEPDEY